MQEKSKEFVDKGSEVYLKATTPCWLTTSESNNADEIPHAAHVGIEFMYHTFA